MKNNSSFEALYNIYSAMLYSVALEISPNQKAAEEILILTFQKVYKKKLTQQNHPSICATLLKLVIETAQEQLNPDQIKSSFKLKQFEKAPILHKLLCEQISLTEYCEKSRLTRSEIAIKLREEVVLLRKLSNENPLSIQKQWANPGNLS